MSPNILRPGRLDGEGWVRCGEGGRPSFASAVVFSASESSTHSGVIASGHLLYSRCRGPLRCASSEKSLRSSDGAKRQVSNKKGALLAKAEQERGFAEACRIGDFEKVFSGVLDTHYNTSVASAALSSQSKLQRCGKLVERRVDDDVGLDRVESSTCRTRGRESGR